ncbi:Smr/MutS family protein, partial [Rhizobium sp. BR5]
KIHQPMEKPVKRKLTRGRLPLEGRIDLHGMFQSEAHAVLLDFLLRAHERGLRHVLVITGKGRSIG